MELLEVYIKHYKIHQEKHIVFDQGLNCIVGNNESGKSTIVDAIHKALFLSAKGKTQVHRALKSTNENANPLVRLKFKVKDEVFTLTKEFLGNEAVTLSGDKIGKLEDEQAELKLSQLIGEETGVKHNQLTSKWKHLWILQGQAGSLNIEDLKDQQQSLFQNLKNDGLGGIILSELDKFLMKNFYASHDQIFTSSGKAKANSELHLAEENLKNAQAIENKAKEGYSELMEAVNRLVIIEPELSQKEQSKKETLGEIETLKAELLKVNQVLETKEHIDKIFEQKSKVVKAFSQELESLKITKQKFATIKVELSPLADKKERLTKQIQELKQKSEAISSAVSQLQMEKEHADSLKLYFSTAVSKSKNLKHLEELSVKKNEVEQLILECEKEKNNKASLPIIKSEDIKDLNSLQQNIIAKENLIKSIATTFVVEKIQDEVKIDDKLLSVQEEITIDKISKLFIGEGTEITIKPGGGNQLVTVQNDLEQAKIELRLLFRRLGINDTDKAEEIHSTLKRINAKIELLDFKIKALNPTKINEEIDALKTEINNHNHVLSGLENELETEKSLDNEDPESAFEKAEQFVSVLQKKLKEIYTQQSEVNNLMHQKSRELQAIEEAFVKVESEFRDLKAELASFRSRLGEDDEISQKEKTLKEELKSAESDKVEIENKLKVSEVEQKKDRLSRFEKSIQNFEDAIDALKKEQTELKYKLTNARRSGTDFKEVFSLAEANLIEAERNYQDVRKRAEAIKLLKDLFENEQQKLMDEVIGPFKKVVGKYLKIVFGSDTEVMVEMENGSFTKLRLKRQNTNQEFDFDDLSGGAQEQFANAVRIAMAETLAKSFNGTLPLVLDESFNNTDPIRLEKVHDMLHLAAKNGLQIIVLSSDPKDFEKLGAKQILI